MTDYQTRYREIRKRLAQLPTIDSDEARNIVGVHMHDQLTAAQKAAANELRRLGDGEATMNPERLSGTVRKTSGQDRVDDFHALVLAALEDVRGWTWCRHLDRQPAQPAWLFLPFRRGICKRCLATATDKAQPADSDRCDLCGSRGNTTFWPLRATIDRALVIGDVCGGCAAGLKAAGTDIEAGEPR